MAKFISTKNFVWFLLGVLIPVNVVILYIYIKTDVPRVAFFAKLPANQTDLTVSGRDLTVSLPDERCILPKLNPFDPSVLVHTKHNSAKINCETKEHPLIFKTDLDSNLIVDKCPLQFALESCCYKRLIPNERHVDRSPSYSKDCTRLKNSTAKIPSDIENIGVFCIKMEDTTINSTNIVETSTKSSTNTSTKSSKGQTSTISPEDPLQIVDILPLLSLKPDVENRILNMTKVSKDSDAFSVVILGLDSISHMDLIRSMPKTLRFITEDLDGMGLNGYVSVGGNTRPNVFAAFTGHIHEELLKICWKNTKAFNLQTTFDTCPFVWKNFSAQGYRTSYAEDNDKITVFNYNTGGFIRPPTDYYLHTLMRAQREVITHTKGMCHGPRVVLDILLDHMLDIATIMEKRKYFQVIWSSSMTHDFSSYRTVIDDKVYSALRRMKEEGNLNNKVFIFLSDHGYRWSGYRNTYQGQIEVRMPFFYIALPEAFTKRYPGMAINLRVNANRLTSPFDLYVTLLQLSTLATVENEDDNRRFYTRWLNPTPTKKNWTVEIPSNGRGISLFDQIPLNRTCKSAGIPDPFCVCHSMTKIPSNGADVKEAAHSFVQWINAKLKRLQTKRKI